MTFAAFSAFPDFGNPLLWMPAIAGVLIMAAVGAGIGSNSERKDIALVLGTALTGLLIAMQLVEMRRVYNPIADQAQTLRTQIEEMRLEQRAWVSITSITIVGASRDTNGINLTFQYSVENSGHNPATNAFLNTKLYIGTVATGTTAGNVAVENQLCRSPFVQGYSGFAVFPGQKKNSNSVTWTLPQAEIDRAEKNFGERIDSIPISALVCLAYKDAVTQTWRGTPEAYLIERFSETSFGGIPFDNEALSKAHLVPLTFPWDVAPPF